MALFHLIIACFWLGFLVVGGEISVVLFPFLCFFLIVFLRPHPSPNFLQTVPEELFDLNVLEGKGKSLFLLGPLL